MNRFYFFLALATAIALPKAALAHGANVEYRATEAITIQAKYDDGKPMANAQVVVYAPSDRASPWLQGTTDKSGNFTFVPNTNAENIGNWDVKVRQAGHGDITTIHVQDKLAVNKMTVAAGAGYTTAQKLVMAAAVGWGFIGTGLFFARSKSQ